MVINHQLVRLSSLLIAVEKLIRQKGGRLLPKEKIQERLELCKPCPHFHGDECALCECCAGKERKYLNKLAYPTERCPDNPPKWLEIL